MLIKLDGIVNPELKDFLLSQVGIIDVEIKYDDFYININIKLNEKTTPNIVMKYIKLFENKNYSDLVEFYKDYKGKTKELKYIVDDMCCEFCYKDLVMYLFENNIIKSVKSNFEFDKPAFNIEFIIEYDEKYKEEDIIKYIKKRYING